MLFALFVGQLLIHSLSRENVKLVLIANPPGHRV